MLVCTVLGGLGKFGQQFLASKPLRILGKFCYLMYFFQRSLIPLLGFLISPTIVTGFFGNPFAGGVAYVTIIFAIDFVLAVVSWYCLERWFLRITGLKLEPTTSESLSSSSEVQRSISRHVR